MSFRWNRAVKNRSVASRSVCITAADRAVPEKRRGVSGLASNDSLPRPLHPSHTSWCLRLTWGSAHLHENHTTGRHSRRRTRLQLARNRSSTPSTSPHHLGEACTRLARTREGGIGLPRPLRNTNTPPQSSPSTSSPPLHASVLTARWPACTCQDGCLGAQGGRVCLTSAPVHVDVTFSGLRLRDASVITTLRRDNACLFGGNCQRHC